MTHLPNKFDMSKTGVDVQCDQIGFFRKFLATNSLSLVAEKGC